MKIGVAVASTWGAECVGFLVDKEKQRIEYDCVEHGDFFTTIVTVDELKDYDYLFVEEERKVGTHVC
jgi:hypothetical protein